MHYQLAAKYARTLTHSYMRWGPMARSLRRGKLDMWGQSRAAGILRFYRAHVAKVLAGQQQLDDMPS